MHFRGWYKVKTHTKTLWIFLIFMEVHILSVEIVVVFMRLVVHINLVLQISLFGIGIIKVVRDKWFSSRHNMPILSRAPLWPLLNKIHEKQKIGRKCRNKTYLGYMIFEKKHIFENQKILDNFGNESLLWLLLWYYHIFY